MPVGSHYPFYKLCFHRCVFDVYLDAFIFCVTEIIVFALPRSPFCIADTSVNFNINVNITAFLTHFLIHFKLVILGRYCVNEGILLYFLLSSIEYFGLNFYLLLLLFLAYRVMVAFFLAFETLQQRASPPCMMCEYMLTSICVFTYETMKFILTILFTFIG